MTAYTAFLKDGTQPVPTQEIIHKNGNYYRFVSADPNTKTVTVTWSKSRAASTQALIVTPFDGPSDGFNRTDKWEEFPAADFGLTIQSL